MEYFKRQIELWGQNRQDSLAKKHICIIGSGGLGCSVSYALSSSGIGKITLVDFDRVSVHNIHRQIGFFIEDEGEYKVDALKEKLLQRYDGVEVNVYRVGFEEFSSEFDFGSVDLIVDATDNLPIRQSIDEVAKQNNIPWVYGSVEEFHGQVCFFDKASFADSFVVSNNTPKGITAPMVMQIASLQANITLRYLAGLPIKADMLHYIFFDKFGELNIQKFKMA